VFFSIQPGESMGYCGHCEGLRDSRARGFSYNKRTIKGRSVIQLLEQFPEQFLRKLAGRFRRFPLLLKFLDAHEILSVQVHPSDANESLLPPGQTGKTEAWVVVETSPESRIYAGLKPGTRGCHLCRRKRRRIALTSGGWSVCLLAPRSCELVGNWDS
jgi:hypothetical protein